MRAIVFFTLLAMNACTSVADAPNIPRYDTIIVHMSGTVSGASTTLPPEFATRLDRFLRSLDSQWQDVWGTHPGRKYTVTYFGDGERKATYWIGENWISSKDASRTLTVPEKA